MSAIYWFLGIWSEFLCNWTPARLSHSPFLAAQESCQTDLLFLKGTVTSLPQYLCMRYSFCLTHPFPSYLCSKCLSWNATFRTCLVVQWLRIHLPVQGTWILSLLREDSTCCVTTKPTTGLAASAATEAPASAARVTWEEKPRYWKVLQHNWRVTSTLQLEKALRQQQRLRTAKNKYVFKKWHIFYKVVAVVRW